MIYLLNSAMMPTFNLTYRLRQVDEGTFIEMLKSAKKTGRLKSLIGYPQNVEYLSRRCGFHIQVDRSQCNVKAGDTILVMRLPYRPDAQTKGQTVREDFEYGVVEVEDYWTK